MLYCYLDDQELCFNRFDFSFMLRLVDIYPRLHAKLIDRQISILSFAARPLSFINLKPYQNDTSISPYLTIMHLEEDFDIGYNFLTSKDFKELVYPFNRDQGSIFHYLYNSK